MLTRYRPMACSTALLKPQLVTLAGVMLPSVDGELGRRVAFVDDSSICSVEDLVVRQALRLGWWVAQRVSGRIGRG